MAFAARAAAQLATILVVEDEEDLRDLVVGILRESGYRVLAAGSGSEALAIIAKDPRIDLLFTDIVMPGSLSGFALARQALSMRPDLKILFTTGYSGLAAADEVNSGSSMMSKPYRPSQLLAEVGRILAA